MKYQLIKPINNNYSAIQQVLTNRDIPFSEINKYFNTTDEDVADPLCLGQEVLWEAFTAIAHCISLRKKAIVIVDSDCDGYTSAALIINYLHDLFPSWVENNLTWFIHSGKQHGLSDFPIDLIDKIDLFLIPDASSNDYEYHKQLKDLDKYVVVLDHHEAEKISEDAIIINNQLSDYPNKHLSGVGVVWQFCRYVDSLIDKNYANNYLDLVALGMDADMMSLKSIETKHLINKGFEEENIKNPFFAAICDKHSYSMKNAVTPMSVAFYVAPYVNAIVRSGTEEEKEIVFQSMLNYKAFEKVPSTKRGHKVGEMESLYLQAMRIVTNVKNRQTRAQDAGMNFLEQMIEENNLLDNKVLLFLLSPGQIDKNIAGLIANKMMAKYQRPCCILTKVEEDGKVSYQGSARGCDRAGVINFKEICEKTGCIMFAEGHQGAFGLGIYSHTVGVDNEVAGYNIIQFLEETNKALKDISDEAIYYVDYVYNGAEVKKDHILEIANFDNLWGKDVDEPFIAIKNLKISKDMIVLMSPDKKPTLKITLPNQVSLIKFNSNQEEYDKLYSETGCVEVDIIGRCSVNEWNGYITPQIIIEDYEIVDKMKYIF